MTEIEKTEAEIKVLQAKLELLKEIETHKSQPKMEFDYGGKFEIVSYNNSVYYRLEFPDEFSWYKRDLTFSDGLMLVRITDGETYRLLEGVWFNDVKHGKYDNEVAEPSMINCTILGNPPNGCSSWSEWFELFGSKGILHNLNISAKEYQPTKLTTLYDIIYEWKYNTYDPTCEELVNMIGNWLPKEHDTNSDGWNKCVRMLREKLR